MSTPKDSDDTQYFLLALELADSIEAVLPAWVVRTVEQRCRDAGREIDDRARAAARSAAERCLVEVGPAVRALLESDPDEHRTTPLTLLRSATRYPTAALRELGVPEVQRDDYSVRAFPDDVYDLTPASFGDVDPSLHEPGLMWGAAKAHVHLTRRRAEGKR